MEPRGSSWPHSHPCQCSRHEGATPPCRGPTTPRDLSASSLYQHPGPLYETAAPARSPHPCTPAPAASRPPAGTTDPPPGPAPSSPADTDQPLSIAGDVVIASFISRVTSGSWRFADGERC